VPPQSVAAAFAPIKLGPSAAAQYLRAAVQLSDVASVGPAPASGPGGNAPTARWSTTLISAAPMKVAASHAMSFVKDSGALPWLAQLGESIGQWVAAPLPITDEL